MSTEYLDNLKASYRTPVHVLETIVERTTGLGLCSHAPMTDGYANEVYRVSTSDPVPLVVRIRRQGRISFASEADAMRLCVDAAVPAPAVLGVTAIDIGGETVEAMVMEQSPGRPLSEVQHSLDAAQLGIAVSNLGAVLNRMHQIPFDGFGPPDAVRREANRHWQTYIAGVVADRQTDGETLRSTELREDEVSGLLDIVRTLADQDVPSPSLCHGDISMEHVFVDERLAISGIIDFGMCQGVSGVVDLAALLMFHPELETASLAQGYLGQDAFPDAMRRQILAHQVNIGTSYLAHNERAGNHDSTEIAILGLRHMLTEWNLLEGR